MPGGGVHAFIQPNPSSFLYIKIGACHSRSMNDKLQLFWKKIPKTNSNFVLKDKSQKTKLP
jgi:hypothetical protein